MRASPLEFASISCLSCQMLAKTQCTRRNNLYQSLPLFISCSRQKRVRSTYDFKVHPATERLLAIGRAGCSTSRKYVRTANPFGSPANVYCRTILARAPEGSKGLDSVLAAFLCEYARIQTYICMSYKSPHHLDDITQAGRTTQTAFARYLRSCGERFPFTPELWLRALTAPSRPAHSLFDV